MGTKHKPAPLEHMHGSDPTAPKTIMEARERGDRDDDSWFTANPHRNYRIRLALPREFREWRQRFVVVARMPDDASLFAMNLFLYPGPRFDREVTARRIFNALLRADSGRREHYERLRTDPKARRPIS